MMMMKLEWGAKALWRYFQEISLARETTGKGLLRCLITSFKIHRTLVICLLFKQLLKIANTLPASYCESRNFDNKHQLRDQQNKLLVIKLTLAISCVYFISTHVIINAMITRNYSVMAFKWGAKLKLGVNEIFICSIQSPTIRNYIRC